MKKLNKITLNDFKKGIRQAINEGNTHIAPLGVSGDEIYLHLIPSSRPRDRCQQVSLRLYGNSTELLITNNAGSFLFYGKYDNRLGIDFLADEYYRIYNLLLPEIPKEFKDKTNLNIKPYATVSRGFEILNSAKKYEEIKK